VLKFPRILQLLSIQAQTAFILAVIGMTAISAHAQEQQPPQPLSPNSLLDTMAERAKTLASQAFQQPGRDLPTVLANMSYDQYRRINFRPEAALWRGESPFEVQFFYPGFLYREPVTIRTVTLDGANTPLPFDPALFNYHGDPVEIPPDSISRLGFAGLRVHYPLNNPNYKDEFLVFQGASYFRLVGPGQVYGLSARGLAVNTAESSGEEFPTFREFWLVKPTADASRLWIIALLDSPSLTGAYSFEVLPGAPTSVTVEARLFPRRDIPKLGIAPLTSMFFYGENRTRFIDDFRPEVHDSDGLLMQTGAGEWIWRPLTNSPELRVTSLQDKNPLGFGLLQRDRNFDNYQDTEAKYELRPSLWIEPEGEWGDGRLELVEIPTDAETNDNVVSYWIPAAQVKAGSEWRFRYRMTTFDDRLPQHDKAHVVRTRIGWATLPGHSNPPPRSKRQFVVDFAGGALASVPAALQLTPDLQINNGSAEDIHVTRLPDGHTWRVSFKLNPQSDAPVDMRLFLALREQRLSEVWNYVWSPTAVR
jgi:Periplasmic glucans biosynthesis protein